MQACELTFTKEIKEMLSKITKGKALIALYQQLLSVVQKDLHSLPLDIMQKKIEREVTTTALPVVTLC